jgi:glutamate 5-kinase
VAAGRHVLAGRQNSISNPVTQQQVLAAAGQVRLMEIWQSAFRAQDLTTAQVLVSKRDFQTRQHYLNTRACLEGLLAARLIPVINENDVVSVTELMFTDNDELAGLLATMMSADELALLSSVAGVLDDREQVIPLWNDALYRPEEIIQQGTSALGRGGMHSKLAVARKTAALGTAVTIADGRLENILLTLSSRGETETAPGPGTRFPAAARSTAAKRWLASMDDHALGAITINEGALEALLDPARLTSLLPVGVTRVEGDFHSGDVIQVRTAAGRVLGCGRSQYDASEASKALGQHDQRPLIHYDYLYMIP